MLPNSTVPEKIPLLTNDRYDDGHLTREDPEKAFLNTNSEF